jgi:peptidoglycan-associated lipoprotein
MNVLYYKKWVLLLLISPCLLLLACTTTNTSETVGDGETVVPVEDRTGITESHNNGNSTETYEGQTGGYNESGMSNGITLNGHGQSQSSGASLSSDPNHPLSVRTIYFEYNSVTIRSDSESALNAHAEYLSLNPNKLLILDGHTDERGTRGYNLSLSEQRAKAVADFLLVSGVQVEQIEIRSHGEENPAQLGHNEGAWQLNRRVELRY